MERGWRGQAKRYGAPAAFLFAVTVAVLLVRSGLQSDPAPATSGAPQAAAYSRARSGETLSDVAIEFNTTVAQLLALNPGVQPTNLTVGQRIRVK